MSDEGGVNPGLRTAVRTSACALRRLVACLENVLTNLSHYYGLATYAHTSLRYYYGDDGGERDGAPAAAN